MEKILGDADPFGVVLACVFLLIVAAIAAYVVMWLRRRLNSDESDAPGAGFTLGDLRQLHRAGKISDAEFQHVKDKVVAAAQQAAQRQTAKQPPDRNSA